MLPSNEEAKSMATDKQLHGTVVHQLPADINLRKIQVHVSLQSGLNKAWGETYLLVHENELVLLTRGSVFDEYEKMDVSPGQIPKLEESTSITRLIIQTSDGERGVNVSRAEVPEVKRLISVLEGIYA